MSEMLRRTEIIKAITAMLESKFCYEIYSGEVVEDFETPCFFVKLIKRTDNQTTNFNDNQLSIIITFFADPEKK